jgi:hypothetical protein
LSIWLSLVAVAVHMELLVTLAVVAVVLVVF